MGVLVMQKQLFATTINKTLLINICNLCRLQITQHLTLLISRFCVHETPQIYPSNFLYKLEQSVGISYRIAYCCDKLELEELGDERNRMINDL